MMAFTCRSLAPLGDSGTGHPNTPQSLSPPEVVTEEYAWVETTSGTENSAVSASLASQRPDIFNTLR